MQVQRLVLEGHPPEIAVDLLVVHQQGVAAVPAHQHIAEVRVRVLHQQKLEVGVPQYLEAAGMLPQQSAVVVHLQLAAVVQASEAEVRVVLEVVVAAAVFRRHLVVVPAAHLHRVEVLMHLLLMATTRPCRPATNKLWLGMIFYSVLHLCVWCVLICVFSRFVSPCVTVKSLYCIFC